MASPQTPNTPSSAEHEESSRGRSAESSAQLSREGSRPRKKRHNVRFTPGGEKLDIENKRSVFHHRADSDPPPKPRPLIRPRAGTGPLRDEGLLGHRQAKAEASEDITEETARAPIRKTKSIFMRLPSNDSDDEDEDKDEAEYQYQRKLDKGKGRELFEKEDERTTGNDYDASAKAQSQRTAQEKAALLSRKMGSHSAPGSRYTSPTRGSHTFVHSPSSSPSPPWKASGSMPFDLDDIPLEKLTTRRTKFGIEDMSDDGADDDPERQTRRRIRERGWYKRAVHLVKKGLQELKPKKYRNLPSEPPSGTQTPVNQYDPEFYVPRPKQYREGLLSSMLRIYDQQGLGSAIAHLPSGAEDAARAVRRSFSSNQYGSLLEYDGAEQTPERTPATTPGASPGSSGATTPKQKHPKWYYKTPASQSTGALSDLVSSSTMMAQPGGSAPSSVIRPKPKHRNSSQAFESFKDKISRRKEEPDPEIRARYAQTSQRCAFLLKMCRALMAYGAPTHRLEEYMRMCSRALAIDGQFLYIPGCVIISFDDKRTHTTEVKIVRAAHSIDLGKLKDTHEIYKEVIHDVIGVEEAIERLDEITRRSHSYPLWIRILVYGFASLCVGPFAFGARPVDLPIIFGLGCLLGLMQLYWARKSELYANVFEVAAAIITSFLARAFGSIRHGELFCFSALAQSAIAMILPGYIILCGSLELQSRNIVAGSIRIVYAVIYSLFLGYGITIGTAVYGAMDKNATSDTTCRTDVPGLWYQFMFVPPFILCLTVVNGAKWKQTPVMMIIACIGFIVNFYSSKQFPGNAQIANTLGALSIGFLGNVYSRTRHGLAAAAVIPAIFVQVPSGLAAGGSLVSGLVSANQITRQSINGTYAGAGNTTISKASDAMEYPLNGIAFSVAFSMMQVAIGITVGLFLSALVVYPLGKRRSGLFSF